MTLTHCMQMKLQVRKGFLDQVLEARGITRTELARRIGVAASQPHRWMHKATGPNGANLIAMSIALSVRPEQFYGVEAEAGLPAVIDVIRGSIDETTLEIIKTCLQLSNTDRLRVLERAATLLEDRGGEAVAVENMPVRVMAPKAHAPGLAANAPSATKRTKRKGHPRGRSERGSESSRSTPSPDKQKHRSE